MVTDGNCEPFRQRGLKQLLESLRAQTGSSRDVVLLQRLAIRPIHELEHASDLVADRVDAECDR